VNGKLSFIFLKSLLLRVSISRSKPRFSLKQWTQTFTETFGSSNPDDTTMKIGLK
jgi:hypothetical protein